MDAAWLSIPLQIVVVDLLLGADNALLIAIACNGLSREDARRAAVIGSGGAIVLRLVLATIATSLLAIPLVKLIGAWALIVIALNVAADPRHALPTREPGSARPDLWAAATAIVVADAAMSLDNVVALAAIARGNFWLLAAGVVVSIPVLAYGGLVLAAALRAAPWLVKLGAALLGWIAGGMAVSDPLLGGWVDANAPALAAIAPALAAIFVYFVSPPARLLTQRAAERRAPSAGPPDSQTPPPPPPPRARPKLVAATPATATRVVAPPKPDFEPPEPEGRVEAKRVGLSPEDRFAVIGVLVLTLIAGIVLMLVSYLDSVN